MDRNPKPFIYDGNSGLFGSKDLFKSQLLLPSSPMFAISFDWHYMNLRGSRSFRYVKPI